MQVMDRYRQSDFILNLDLQREMISPEVRPLSHYIQDILLDLHAYRSSSSTTNTEWALMLTNSGRQYSCNEHPSHCGLRTARGTRPVSIIPATREIASSVWARRCGVNLIGRRRLDA